MDIEDVDISVEFGSLIAVHRACGETVEQFTVGASLESIVNDVEACGHECDAVVPE